MEIIAQRLYDYFFKHKQYKNDTVISIELGYTHPEKISRLFREGKEAKPSADILSDIAKKFGNDLNIEWVLTGKGEMIKKSGDQQPPDSDLLTLIENHVKTVQLSLDELSKVLVQPVGPGTNAHPNLSQTVSKSDRKNRKRKLKGT